MQHRLFRQLSDVLTVLLVSILLASPYITAKETQSHPTIAKSSTQKHTIAKSNHDETKVQVLKSVLKLDSRNFDAEVRKTDIMLVEFYAPWCSHCQHFESTYTEVYHFLQRTYPYLDITVAKVDGAYERALSSRFNIRGYPSFFLIRGWSVWSYQGPRTKDDMVKFVASNHKDLEPMPFLNSPFGPLGLMKAWLMYVGIKLIDMHEFLVQKGLSGMLAAGIMTIFGFFSFVICIVVIGIKASAKMKTD